MIYKTAIDRFHVTDEELENSPSRKDRIDSATETTLRIYKSDLIQESGILQRLPQSAMVTGQVLFHHFYCKNSFAKFNVKSVAASYIWLVSKLEESPRKARQVIATFHRMECRGQNPDSRVEKYEDLKSELVQTERQLLREFGFNCCNIEHPRKFLSNYLVAVETPDELVHSACLVVQPP